RRTTESFTLQSVWLYHLSVQAFTSDGTSIKFSAGNLISNRVVYGEACGSLIGCLLLPLFNGKFLQKATKETKFELRSGLNATSFLAFDAFCETGPCSGALRRQERSTL